jgi:hypothetical protein
VALSWDDTKALMRLSGLVEELLAPLASRQSNSPLRAASAQLEAVVEEALRVLDAADERMAEELRRLVEAGGSSFRSVEARGAALAGWLKTAVEAEALERRIAAEAKAYAQERVRAERPVGFGSAEVS